MRNHHRPSKGILSKACHKETNVAAQQQFLDFPAAKGHGFAQQKTAARGARRFFVFWGKGV
ncbi:MAG: hypothetical protein AAGK25_04375 [Pseudomonadota bacterium]